MNASMLAILADIYTPLLVCVCAFALKPLFTLKRLLSFVFAFLYITLFSIIEMYFGWWLIMEANFSSHTAFVIVFVFALLQGQIKTGVIAFGTVFAYGYLMTILNYHSWFDILTTMVVCLPCWWFFSFFNKESIN